MRFFINILFLLLCICSIVHAQVDYEITGYITDLPIYQRTNKELSGLFGTQKDNFTNISRIRIRPQFYIGDNVRINIEYEITSLYMNSLSEFNLLSSTGKTNRQLVNLSKNFINNDKFVINHFIDRLYFRYGFAEGNIIIGRQRISWGTGRVWNPTDLFNPINPANFSKIEKDGADAISFKYIFGSFTDLQLVYNPLDEIGKSNFGGRFRTNLDEYDISLMGGRFDEDYVIGADFAGNLYDAGVRGEGIYALSGESYYKIILGIDFQFTPELYALAEYHYNGEGKTVKLDYELLKLVRGEILNLNRNYLAVSGSYLLTPLINLTISNTLNLNDKSGYLGFSGNYSLISNLDLTAGIQITYGDQFSEYWYYPASFYFKCDYYF